LLVWTGLLRPVPAAGIMSSICRLGKIQFSTHVFRTFWHLVQVGVQVEFDEIFLQSLVFYLNLIKMSIGTFSFFFVLNK